MTVASRANPGIPEDDSPQITRHSFVVGPSKSQCDAPCNNVERSNPGAARAIERPLPYRLQPERSASSTTDGAVICAAA